MGATSTLYISRKKAAGLAYNWLYGPSDRELEDLLNAFLRDRLLAVRVVSDEHATDDDYPSLQS